MSQPRRVNCRRCHFFYVTWDPNGPYGCRMLGFKTKVMPSMAVMRASGQPCNYFRQKTQKTFKPNKK